MTYWYFSVFKKWPGEVPEMEQTLSQLFDSCTDVALLVLRLMAVGLELKVKVK